MSNERIPIDRYIKNRIPAPSAENEERFSDEEIDSIKTEFAKRLRGLFRGQTDAEIARALKIRQSVLKNYLDAQRLPTAEILIQIQYATGASVSWLLTGKGSSRIADKSVFTEEEENQIREMALKSNRSFDEQLRALAMGAVELIRKI